MKKIALTLALALTCFSYAALPPLYQTSNEIKAILESPELGQKLGSGDVIMSIQKNQQGYEIVTNKNRLQVDVSEVPTGRPGPDQFKLNFKSVHPLR